MLPENIKALILDMDGVIWKSDAPIGDLPEIFARIRARGLKFIFATNNGTRTPDQYMERLASLGVQVEAWQIVTSALGVANMLTKKFPRGSKIFVIGEDGVREALRAEGFEVLSVEDAPQAQAFVFGIDRSVSFQKMAEATLLIRRGIPFYATNPDRPSPPRAEKSPAQARGYRPLSPPRRWSRSTRASLFLS